MNPLNREWEEVQKRTFANWCNLYLAKRGNKVENITTDLKSGVLLCQLLEELSGTKLKHNPRPMIPAQQLDNCNVAINFVKSQKITLVGIGPMNILNGDSTQILGLIWTLIQFYQIKPSDEASNGPVEAAQEKSAQAILLSWVNQQVGQFLPTIGFGAPAVTNFTTQWQDGRLLSALTESLKPGMFDLSDLSSDPSECVGTAMMAADKGLNIPRLVEAEDMVNATDALSTMTYIALFRSHGMLKKQSASADDIAAARAEADARAAAALAAQHKAEEEKEAAKRAAEAEAARLLAAAEAEANKLRREMEQMRLQMQQKAEQEAAAKLAAQQKMQEEEARRRAKAEAEKEAALRKELEALRLKQEADARRREEEAARQKAELEAQLAKAKEEAERLRIEDEARVRAAAQAEARARAHARMEAEKRLKEKELEMQQAQELARQRELELQRQREADAQREAEAARQREEAARKREIEMAREREEARAREAMLMKRQQQAEAEAAAARLAAQALIDDPARREAEERRRMEREAREAMERAAEEERKAEEMRARDALERGAPIYDKENDAFTMPDGCRLVSPNGRVDMGVLKTAIWYDTQLQILHIMIYEARGLQTIDGAPADTYAKIYILPDKHKLTKQKTATVRKNCNPIWNDSFQFDIPHEELFSKTISMQIWHEGMLQNTFIGNAECEVWTVPWDCANQNHAVVWYAIQPRDLGAAQFSGSIDAKGCKKFPDGTMRLPSGHYQLTDGKIIAPNSSSRPGFKRLPDGCLMNETDQSVILPSGAITMADGNLRYPDGSIRPALWRFPGAMMVPEGVLRCSNFSYRLASGEKLPIIEPPGSNTCLKYGIVKLAAYVQEKSRRIFIRIIECLHLPEGVNTPWIQVYHLPTAHAEATKANTPPVKCKAGDPTFNTVMSFAWDPKTMANQVLEISLWNDRMMRSAEFIGQVILPVRDIPIDVPENMVITWHAFQQKDFDYEERRMSGKFKALEASKFRDYEEKFWETNLFTEVRVRPSSVAPVVGVLEAGTIVEALQWDGVWLRLKRRGDSKEFGWCRTKTDSGIAIFTPEGRAKQARKAGGGAAAGGAAGGPGPSPANRSNQSGFQFGEEMKAPASPAPVAHAQGPAPKKWICKSCTFENVFAATKCEMCGSPAVAGGQLAPPSIPPKGRSSVSAPMSPQSVPASPQHASPAIAGPWNCSLCLYTNGPDLSKCSMCGTAAPATVKRAPSVSASPSSSGSAGNWSCRMCTFANPAGSAKCQICGSVKT